MKDQFNREIKYMRVSLTERCNLRCRYCMPEEGICKKSHFDMLTEEETIRAIEVGASLGITKIRLTGGEPLVKKNILSIASKAGQIQGITQLCLTTNATLLKDLAGPLKAAGVSRINVSLDTLNPEKYAYITRRDELANALEGLEAALEAGFEKIKVNAVLIGGFNDNEIRDLAELTLKYPIDMRFIELMPMTDNPDFGPESYIPVDKVLEKVPELMEGPVNAGRTGAGDVSHDSPSENPSDDGVARLYHLPGALGNVGLISPLSNHFCGTCSRLRLTADGKLKPCLHSSDEIPVKGLSKEEMREQFIKAVNAKPLCHGTLSAESKSPAGRDMNQIGG